MAGRVRGLKPSPTLAITARAASLRASGEDVISFAAGEPDFRTPSAIVDAAIDALKDGFTRYTSGNGILPLREAIAEKFTRENGISVDASQVVATCGAKHALADAILAIVEPGDEVIILAPFWMSYHEQVVLAGGMPVLVHCRIEDRFVPDPDAVSAAITPRTKAILLCSPNNPTGAVWPRETMEALVSLAVQNGLWIISDEVYEKLIYEGEHVSPASLSPDAFARTLTIGSCSKTYAMTGWRIGFITGPAPAMEAIASVQDTISHPTSFAQRAAITAFTLDDRIIEEMREEYRRRRDAMYAYVSSISGVLADMPPGAFYVFADFGALVGDQFPDDWALAEHLLQEAKVAVIPGAVFFAPGYLRFSYATGMEEIHRGMARVCESLQAVAL